jgi:hypothetical protein
VALVTLKRHEKIVTISSPFESVFITSHHVLKTILIDRSPNWKGISNRNGIALPAPYLPACFEIPAIAAEVGA